MVLYRFTNSNTSFSQTSNYNLLKSHYQPMPTNPEDPPSVLIDWMLLKIWKVLFYLFLIPFFNHYDDFLIIRIAVEEDCIHANVSAAQRCPSFNFLGIVSSILLLKFNKIIIIKNQIEPDSRAWFVKLIGEGATDAGINHSFIVIIIILLCVCFRVLIIEKGGPYFEILSQMCKDLQSLPLSLFIPCPNAQIATEQEGSVANRDKVFIFIKL